MKFWRDRMEGKIIYQSCFADSCCQTVRDSRATTADFACIRRGGWVAERRAREHKVAAAIFVMDTRKIYEITAPVKYSQVV